jgi:two-component system, OmpR family, copper resistance phosphate regulon response regulator CusR
MRILIIEDEQKLAKTVKTVLEAERFTVDLSGDGEDGFHKASTEDYDLILLDVGLPKKNGFEVCRDLRHEGVTTPVIMLTARDAMEDKIEGLDTGADDYVVKPFSFDELLARMRALIRRNTQPAQTVLAAGNLTLEPSGHLVMRSGKVIDLSAKEYALLEYMLRHKNQIVSKQTLLDHVWGSHIDPFSKVIDVYIGYLRKKIDLAFPDEPALIHTTRGMGYKIGDPA